MRRDDGRNEPIAETSDLPSASTQEKELNMSSVTEEYNSYAATLPGPEDREALLGLAQRDMRGEASDFARQYLESDGIIDHYSQLLLDLIKDIDTQLVEKKARLDEFHIQCKEDRGAGKDEWFKERARYNRWRGGALRVKRSAELRRREIREIIKHRHEAERKADKGVKLYELRRVLQHCREFLVEMEENEGEAFRSDTETLLGEIEEVLGR